MNRQADLASIMGIMCFVIGAILLVALVIAIFYLLTLQKAPSRVSPRNRLMEPGLVWLELIPCFNLIWQFFVAVRVPDSLRNEFRDRNRDDGSDYGKSLALTQAVLGVVSGVGTNVLAQASPDLALIGNGLSVVFSIVGLILFILFWVKIAGYSRQLAEDSGPPRDWERKFDDDDDDGFGKRGPYTDAPRPPPDAIKEGDPGHYQ
jgi:uncharacterized membrane protein